MDKKEDEKLGMKQEVKIDKSQNVTVTQTENIIIELPKRLPTKDYNEYFDQISRIRKEEFEHLGNWVDLHAVETKLTSQQEYDRGKTLSALNLINECVKAARNALIFGESGAGKTFTCLKLFEEIKEKYCRSDAAINKRIPRFVELSRVKNKNNDLDKLIREGINEDQFDTDKDKYLIFLDGLNEVGDLEDQKRIFSEIKRFCVSNPETRLFVTTQTIAEYHQRSGFELYEIQLFGKEDVIGYLCKFKDKFESRQEAESFYDDLPDLIKGFISIPVFLYLVVSIYEKGMQARIISPGQLIGRYEGFLCGPRESRPIDLDKDYRTGVIPFIAFNMCQNNEINLGLRDFNEYVHQYNRDNSSSINERELKKIVTNEFMLMKADGERHDLRFIFQALRDYFAAVYMKSKAFNPDKISELVYTDSVMNSDIVNAVRLLACIVKPEAAKGIIQVFIEKDPYLACEIYAWSSIAGYEAGFIDVIKNKIDIRSREYLLNLNRVVSFYLKVLDLIKKAEGLGTLISTDYMQDLGIAYWYKSDHERAIEAYKEAIGIYEKNDMQSHPEYARCHVNLGNAYTDKLDYDGAIEAHKKAIGIYETNNMQSHPDYAKCHMNLGNAYNNKSDHDRAIEAYKEAIGIYEKNDMQSHPEYARCHMNLGNAYTKKLDHDRAIEACEKAIGIYEKNGMQSYPDYAICHMNLGDAYCGKLDYDRATEAYKEAIGIYEENGMQSHLGYARCHMDLGAAYRNKLDYDGAIEAYRKAIGTYEKNNMQTHPNYALCHTFLGDAYCNKLDYDRAIEAHKEAIGIYEKNNMQTHPEYAECHMCLGVDYWNKSDYDTAIEAYKKAIGIYEKNNMQSNLGYALCHVNLGDAYRDKSDYDTAIEAYKKAIGIYEKHNMQSNPGYALCHMNLGSAYCNKLDYDRAIEAHEKAIGIYEKHNMQPSLYALCHVNLGDNYCNKLDYDTAIEAYKKATGIYEKYNMQIHPEYAECHMSLGAAYANKLDYDGAIEAYKKAIGIYEKHNMQSRPYYDLYHVDQGMTYRNRGERGAAIQAFMRALSIFEQRVGKDHPDYKHCLKILNDVRSG